MKLRLITAIALSLAIALAAAPCASLAAPAEDHRSGSVDVTYKITLKGEKPQSMNAKVHFTKDKARIDSSGMPGSVLPKGKNGEKNVVIVDGLKMVAYAIIPGMGYAIMYKLESLAFTGGKPAGHPGEMLNPEKYPAGTKITKSGTKKYMGAKVTVYTVTFSGKGASMPMTVYANSANLPVYIRGTAGDAPYEATFKNYRFFKPAAKLFELPPDMPIMDISSLEKALRS